MVMANSSCIAVPAASPFKTLARNPPKTLHLPSQIPLLSSSFASSRKFRRLIGTWSSPKAIYSSGTRVPDRSQREGIWSIRDDLVVPSSPYFPVEAQEGQGPPPMVQERFQSIISQLLRHSAMLPEALPVLRMPRSLLSSSRSPLPRPTSSKASLSQITL